MSTQQNIRLALLVVLLYAAWSAMPTRADDTSQVDVNRLTKAQVAKIATDFCQSIGITNLMPDEILTPALYRQRDITEDRWHPDWRLRLNRHAKTDDTTEVEVDDLTGTVVGYQNLSLAPVADGASPITEEQAVAEATDLLTKAGAFKSGELRFKDAVPSGPIINGKLDAQWLVRWSRQVKGVPYRRQGASVLIHAGNGEVIGFDGGPTTPPPDSTDTNINKEQATAVAAGLLATVGLIPTTSPAVKEEVLQPNTFWQTGGNDSDEVSFVRLAWTLRYRVDTQLGPRYAEVWVDAQTGAVIGGEYSGGRGGLTLDKKAAQAAAKPAPAAPSVTPAKTPAKK